MQMALAKQMERQKLIHSKPTGLESTISASNGSNQSPSFNFQKYKMGEVLGNAFLARFSPDKEALHSINSDENNKKDTVKDDDDQSVMMMEEKNIMSKRRKIANAR